MKRLLLLVILLSFTLTLWPQMGTKSSPAIAAQKAGSESSNIKVSIYPVPVTNNSFTIKTDRDISYVKITNVIGQDIFKSKYSNPQQLIRITLDAPQRGIYLVTITFSDGFRIVKKIMIEESK